MIASENPNSMTSCQQSSAATRSRIDALTGVRALAAFLVFFSHFPILLVAKFNFINGILRQGYIGVTLFFVLSGFLIAYTYADRLQGTALSYGDYLWRRIVRIFPVYLLALLITGVILIYQHRLNLINHYEGAETFTSWLVLQLTLLKGYFIPTVFSGVPQAWSLTVEITFYLLAPFILVCMQDRRRFMLIPVSYLIALLLLIVVYSHFNWHYMLANFHFAFLYTFWGRCFEFFVGVWLALKLLRTPDFLFFIPYKTVMGLLGVFLTMGLLYLCQLSGYQFGFDAPLGMILANLILPLWVALFFLGLIQERTSIAKFFSTSVLQILGKASYAFYLFQFVVMAFLLNDFSFRIAAPHHWFVILGGFVLLNGVAVLIYYGVEAPLQRCLMIFKKKTVTNNSLTMTVWPSTEMIFSQLQINRKGG